MLKVQRLIGSCNRSLSKNGLREEKQNMRNAKRKGKENVISVLHDPEKPNEAEAHRRVVDLGPLTENFARRQTRGVAKTLKTKATDSLQ